ncbi:MAG: NUDIX domain-containing protein [bacterium]|nr:NUDIX domain-containing protein [bacterium]
MNETPSIRVGVGVMVLKDDRVLLGRRNGSHGAGEFAFPGGHLEYLESFEECARREVLEECGVAITNIRFQFISNVRAYAPKHYVHIGLIAAWASGDPTPREPEKCEAWEWYASDALPTPLFAFCAQAIESNRTGKTYYDAPL